MSRPLQVSTPGDREILVEREFAAPRSLVWDAYSRPELLRRWLLGPPGWEMTVCESDLRVGGAFRHAWRHASGSEMVMSGTYREVAAPERIVSADRFTMGCDAQAGEQLSTLTLTPRGDHALMQVLINYPSPEARDAALASGMEHGMAAGYARLDGLLASSLPPSQLSA